jgi:uncharacterized protein (TIGR03437 family)
MLFPRALLILATGVLPALGATFGTVVTLAQPVADLVLDEARQRIYVVNTDANDVEVYATNTNPPHLTATIPTGATPLAAALSRAGNSLYVACYGASAITIVNLTSTSFATTSVALSAKPQGIAVGFNELVLISTIGTGTGADVLVTYNPTASANNALASIAIGPPAPTAPSLPPPSNDMALAAHSRLQASSDGAKIIGVNETSTTARNVFVFDVASATVVGARYLTGASTILGVAPDGSTFVTGNILVQSSTMVVLAQQSATNSPFVFPATANFTTETNQGGAVYATGSSGLELITGYNITPVQNPAVKSNTAQLLINSPTNMLISLGIMLPENLGGRMVITSTSATIYAISQSGFMVLPIGTLAQNPIAMPDSEVALLASDQCGVTAALNSAAIPVRNVGGGKFTPTVQVISTASTSVDTRIAAESYGGNITVSFNSAAARSLGTATPDQLLIQAAEAINIIPNVFVFQNSRNAEAAGTIIPVDIGATTIGLTDILQDTTRQRLYIANPGLNRVEVFDMQKQQFLSPIPVGQLPRSMAFGSDANTMYVANSGGETISIVDLTQDAVTGQVSYPPLPFNANFTLITPEILASSQRDPQVLMSDGSLWKIVGNTVIPWTLDTNVFGTTTKIPSPQSLVSTPEGAYVLLLGGTGIGYLYDASVDDFVSAVQVIPTPLAGYYGPVAAGPNGAYFLANAQILNLALTTVGSGAGVTGPVSGTGLPSPSGPATTSSRPVAAVAAIGAGSFARFSTAVRSSATAAATDPGVIEVVDASSLRTTAAVNALESPLAVVAGTGRTNISGRTMVVNAAGTTAYVLTASGLSVIPLTTPAASSVPTLAGAPLVNQANQTSGVAPGGLVSVMGKNLAATASSSSTPLATVMGGVCVTLNNSPLPLEATSGTQINAQLPFNLAAGRYPLVVHSIANLVASTSVTVTVAKYAPAIFVDSDGPAIFHANGQRVNKQHPATRDEPLTILATGLGVTTGGAVTAGEPSPSSPLAVTAKVSLYFGNPLISQSAVIVNWSGLEPGMIGVYQIDCKIPGTHLNGNALPVTLRIGGVSSITTGPTAAVVYVN